MSRILPITGTVAVIQNLQENKMFGMTLHHVIIHHVDGECSTELVTPVRQEAILFTINRTKISRRVNTFLPAGTFIKGVKDGALDVSN